MLFFHIWNANFSVTPINSQMYMTKPKQVQKKTLRKNWENFFRNYALFYMQGGGIITEITVIFLSWKLQRVFVFDIVNEFILQVIYWQQ